MATIQIGGLPEATTTADSDVLHISASGVDKRITKINLIKSYCEETVVSTGNTYTATEMYNIYRQDVTSASSIISLNAPTFCPCNVHIIADGTTEANTIKLNGGNGVYANGIYANNATGGIHLSAFFDGSTYEWRAVNEITAAYTDTDYIQMWSNGGMTQSGSLAKTDGTEITKTYVRAFATAAPIIDLIPYIDSPLTQAGSNVFYVKFDVNTTTFTYYSDSRAGTTYRWHSVGGKY